VTSLCRRAEPSTRRRCCCDRPPTVTPRSGQRSGVIGRHYMGHVNSVLLAISKSPNPTVFQKTSRAGVPNDSSTFRADGRDFYILAPSQFVRASSPTHCALRSRPTGGVPAPSPASAAEITSRDNLIWPKTPPSQFPGSTGPRNLPTRGLSILGFNPRSSCSRDGQNIRLLAVDELTPNNRPTDAHIRFSTP